MRNHITLPVTALIGGAAGFAVRKWQWLSAYDQDSERFLSGSPATYVLLAVLGAMAVFFLLIAGKSVPRKTPLPPACPSPLYMSMMAAGGFLFFGASVLALLDGMELLQLWRSGAIPMALSYPIGLLLCGGLCLVAGVSVLVMGKSAYRPTENDKASLLAVLPPFTLLVWLFATHQSHATDPIFLRYGIYLTAAALLLLAHYDVAGFYQGQRHTRRFLFCTLMGTTLALTSLADGLSWFQMAMAAACVLSVLAQSFALLCPVQDAPDPEL